MSEITWFSTDGGLTPDEMESLADMHRNPEILERQLDPRYLEWGRYLVNNGLVSEFFVEPFLRLPMRLPDDDLPPAA